MQYTALIKRFQYKLKDKNMRILAQKTTSCITISLVYTGHKEI